MESLSTIIRDFFSKADGYYKEVENLIVELETQVGISWTNKLIRRFCCYLFWLIGQTDEWKCYVYIPAIIPGTQTREASSGIAIGCQGPLSMEECTVIRSVSNRIMSFYALAFNRLKVESLASEQGWRSLAAHLAHNMKNFITAFIAAVEPTPKRPGIYGEEPRLFNSFRLFFDTIQANMLWLHIGGKNPEVELDREKYPMYDLEIGDVLVGIIRSFVRTFDYLALRGQQEKESPLGKFRHGTTFWPPVLEININNTVSKVQSKFHLLTTTYSCMDANKISSELAYMQTGEPTSPYVQRGINQLKVQIPDLQIITGDKRNGLIWIPLIESEKIYWRSTAEWLSHKVHEDILQHKLPAQLTGSFDVGFDEIFFNALRHGYFDSDNPPFFIKVILEIGLEEENIIFTNSIKLENFDEEPKLSGLIGIKSFWEQFGFDVESSFQELLERWNIRNTKPFDFRIKLSIRRRRS